MELKYKHKASNSVSELIKKGNELRRSGNLDEAIDYYKNASQIAPDAFVVHQKLGEILAEQERFEEAIKEYQKAIELNSKSAWLYYKLGDILKRQGKNQDAIHVYRLGIKKIRSCQNKKLNCELGKLLIQEREINVSNAKKINFKHPPFFIVGPGRCGTTLLRRILQSHPDIMIPDENYAIYQSYDIYTSENYQNKGWSKKVDLIFRNLSQQENFQYFDVNPIKQEIATLNKAKLQKLSYLWNCFHRYYIQIYKPSAIRWGDKTPRNVFFLNKIKSIFPDAKFIYLMRDAYDMCASHASMKGREGEYEKGAKRWIQSNYNALDFFMKQKQNILFLRYEDMVRYPKLIIQKVCNFIELEFREDMLDNLATVQEMNDLKIYSHHANSSSQISEQHIGKGRNNLPLDKKNQIYSIVKEWQNLLGYQE